MNRLSWVALFTVGGSLAALQGCNAVLGNETGELAASDGGTTFDAPPPPPAPDAGHDAGQPIDSGAPDTGLTCDNGKKLCDGTCVSSTDPLFGCGASACAPCAMARATSACAGNGTCAIGACNPGYADCDGDPTNGCETDLSEARHCGACNAVCGAAAPICAPSGNTFSCVTGCTAQAPTLCGNQCVDLTNSATHCGNCSNACQPVANGQVSCVSSSCTFTCNPGFHACGNRCVSNSDPATCGGSCTPCAAPANSTATCSNGACGFTCGAGYHLCGSACVSNNDPATCGGSCLPCPAPANATASCANGACGFSCNAGFHACGATCASNDDPLTCGASCTACPAPSGATATCTAGACGFTCPAGTHVCGSSCASNTSPASCGTSCTPCASGPNSTATCNGTACGLTCTAGFGDCDGNPANGCESTLGSDVRNCGVCGRACTAGQTCSSGNCVSPPPDAGPG